jgi:hypothetical protein
MAKTVKQNQFMHYWGKQAHYTTIVHTAVGVGIGLLLYQTMAVNGTAEIVGWTLVLLGVLGHLYALVA